ncbi:hypothetical protein [Massilia sp. PWRC2]|uniref:hypothetical protein n=1 Tax=Massilia sp. PWRC2 TaxID=2804626 RepID=UPI003CEFC174
MALADLMKKGFITSATATLATVDAKSNVNAPSVAEVAKVAAIEDQIRRAAFSPVAVVAVAGRHIQKPASEDWREKLVSEFMEVDGLTRQQAQAMAAISVRPRTPAEWVEMFADLDALINAYCSSTMVSDEARQHMRASSYSRSLASIPHAIDWFRSQLRALEADRTG